MAETLEEARAVLAEYQGGEYSDVEFTIHGKGEPIPDKAAVLSVSESGV